MKNKDMLFDEKLLIEIFVKSDDICKIIEKELLSKLIEDQGVECSYKKPNCEMTESEIMTLLIFYHYSGFKSYLRWRFRCLFSPNLFVQKAFIQALAS